MERGECMGIFLDELNSQNAKGTLPPTNHHRHNKCLASGAGDGGRVNVGVGVQNYIKSIEKNIN